MKVAVVALIAWTLSSQMLWLLWPGVSNLPGCAYKVSITADCQSLVAGNNEAIFNGHTLPLILVTGAGYAMIIIVTLAWALRRRRSSR